MTRDVRELGGAWARFQHHSFPSPSPDLARYVARYWVVSWRYAEPYRQKIVPLPNVNLTFQGGRATVSGVGSRHQLKVLAGTDGVFVGPKWVIRRYRLREVTERLGRGEPVDWAALAAELGYADQPHFVRDFTKMFDESSTRYAERY